MHRPLRALALAALLTLAATRTARADLDEYLAKPEPAYKWEKTNESTIAGCKVYELHLVSQEWQGKPWEHRLYLIKPEKLDHPGFCTIFNTGGRGADKDVLMGTTIAKQSGCWFAMLFGIPNQPLWDKTEDALVVHTWVEFMKSFAKDGKGDESWPLHFPMAKAVIKGMDAVQACAKQAGEPSIDGFMVCGASKRGWTTWLVGASKDPRVKAIAPMVIDTLNVAKQGPHQLEMLGKPSEQIKDYTFAGMFDALKTPAGKRLLELEDPWSYRARLTMPKLIVNGTNDRYWAQDALNLYWDDLEGPKWVLYVPNSGHALEDRSRVLDTLCAFARSVATGAAFPKVTWRYEAKPDGGVTLALTSDVPLEEARLFHAESKSKDFRDSGWDFAKMTGEEKSWRAEVARPASGNQAVFGEAVFAIGGARFTLSTQIRILEGPPQQTAKK
jgi:PhoPQ-activated pathogenicity-related protein